MIRIDEARRPQDLQPAIARMWDLSAQKILDLEEQGQFRFWDADELAALVERCGFTDVKSELSFGDPAQAVVVSARRA